MRPTYFLEFELTYNTWTNLTADWLSRTPLIIERGIEPGDRVASIGRMTLALHNPDGRYTPGHANVRSGFAVGIGVRLRASDGISTHTLFYGRLSDLSHATTPGQPSTRITVEDDMASVSRVSIAAFTLMLNAAPEAVLTKLIDRAFTSPGLFGYFRLGDPITSRVGLNTLLPGTYTGKSLAAGQSVFPWVGDTWPADAPVRAALIDICASEGGFFHIAADGTPTFEDRHARPRRVTADAALATSMRGVSMNRLKAHIGNEVAVTVHPRTVGTPGEVLWQANTSIALTGTQPHEIVCRYKDASQLAESIGAASLIAPIAGTDYTVTDRADGTGTDYSTQVRIAVDSAGASSARIRVIRSATMPATVYVHNLRLRGTPLRSLLPITAARTDDASLLTYGHHPLIVDMPLQVSAGVAHDVASALLVNHKAPHAWLTVTVDAAASPALLAHALARDVGDRLHVTDATLALSAAPCFVEHIRHEIVRGGPEHRDHHHVTWRTSPADLQAYLVLGQPTLAELGTATKLGY